MPIEAVSRIASCSRSSRATSSAWRFLPVMSSMIQTVPRCGSRALTALATMRERNVEPSRRRTSHSTSSCRPAASTGTAIAPSAS
jgi:hypothetical protein